MFAPISFNVIHEALGWHKMPQPTLRVLSYRDDGDATVAEYLATWPEHVIPLQYFVSPATPVWLDGVTRFHADLLDCFCGDIQVVNVEWNDGSQTMTAILYVRVDNAVIYLAEYMK